MKKIMLGVFASFLIVTMASAANGDETSSRISDLSAQTQRLQSEVENLRAQLNQMERKQKRRRCYRPRNVCHSFNWYQPFHLPGPCQPNCGGIGADLETGFADNNHEFDDFARMWGTPRNLFLLAAIGSTVTTSPYLGLRSAFDASDLIVNLPTMNEDLRFLKEHVLVQKKLDCYGLKLPDRPVIELGGKIEGITFFQSNYNHNLPSATDTDLGSARLDVLVEVSKCVHAFMAFNMDSSNFDLLNNSSLDIQLAGAGNRVFNSRVFVSRAFVTIGNLNCSPFYLTIGQMYIPFGRYASNMVTSTLTAELGRINERALLLGYYQNGVYASVYGFRGDTNVNTSRINNYGANLGYEKSWKGGSVNLGVGHIHNIADSTGMQITGAGSGFFGFGLNDETEIIDNAVPASDVHGEFSLGDWNLFAEYIWTDRRFSVNNLSFNGIGARPTASNLELAYNFKICRRMPASLAVGYGTTTDALGLNFPKDSFITAFNISIWKNTIESIEYRHDNNYESTDFAGGNGAIPLFVNSVGGSRNTVTLQVGVYF